MPDQNQAHREDAAKRQLSEDQDIRQKQQEQRDKLAKGKPTPTQEENDMASLGAPVKDKEDDGSGPDPNVEADKKRAEELKAQQDKRRKESEANKPAGGGYQTRQATPQATQQKPPQR
jgi:hypothetical protein